MRPRMPAVASGLAYRRKEGRVRRAHDAYYTPAWQTRALLAHQEISGSVLEPCAGDGGIVRDGLDDLAYATTARGRVGASVALSRQPSVEPASRGTWTKEASCGSTRRAT